MINGLYDKFNEIMGRAGTTTWIISDTHFGDKEIPNRPDDNEIVKRINSKVGKRDTLILLGDVGDVNYVKNLKGEYKILLLGNHDAGASNYKKEITHHFYATTDENLLRKKLINSYPNDTITIKQAHEYLSILEVMIDNKLFNEVYEGPLFIGEKILLSHEPIYLPFAFNIHGHIHDASYKGDDFHLNVCAEALDYYPLSLNQWAKTYSLKHIESLHRKTIDRATERKANR